MYFKIYVCGNRCMGNTKVGVYSCMILKSYPIKIVPKITLRHVNPQNHCST